MTLEERERLFDEAAERSDDFTEEEDIYWYREGMAIIKEKLKRQDRQMAKLEQLLTKLLNGTRRKQKKES